MKKLTREDFIQRAKEIHGDKYDYSLSQYIDFNTRLIIICPQHGQFEQKPKEHIRNGCGCPKCYDDRRGDLHRMPLEEFISKSNEIHDNKYDYSKVTYQSLKDKVIIICPQHGEFTQQASSHIWGCRGCPRCGGSGKLTTEDFIRKAKEVHGDKYDYSKVKYIGNNIKVTIICPEHGEFEQIAGNHINGKYGCPKCAGKGFSTKEIISMAKRVHKNKYDYSQLEYKTFNEKVKIICPEHGLFEQTPREHIKGKNGCPKCVGNQKLTKEEFVEKANKVHKNKYDYSKYEYVNNHTKGVIICEKHGEFKQNMMNHVHGKCSCPKCNHHISKKEQMLANFIMSLSPKYKYNKKKQIYELV